MTHTASGTPNIWLGRGGLRGGDMGGWAVGFRDALNLLSYLTGKQRGIRAAVNGNESENQMQMSIVDDFKVFFHQ